MTKNIWVFILLGILLLFLGVLFKVQLRHLPVVFGIQTETIYFPEGYVIGTYVWKSPDELLPQEVEELFTYASKEKINTIYIDIGKYVDITEESSPVIRQRKMANFDDAVKLLLLKAQRENVSVQALGGGVLWSNPSHKYIPPLMLDYVLNFNKRNPDLQFAGIQYDIEFYNQGGYKIDKSEYTSNFLNLVKELVKTENENNTKSEGEFKLGFAIPFWFDDQNGGYIFNSLANILNKSKGGYLAIMAYRNYQSGRDGTLSLVKKEMDYIEKNTPNVSVLIAQETDAGESSKITFYGKSKRDFKQAVKTIVNSLKDYRSFGGIAIHHLLSYKQLRDF